MHWNDADEIIRDLRDAPREEILEALRTALLESPAQTDPPFVKCFICGSRVECRECGCDELAPPVPLMPVRKRESTTPFYLSLWDDMTARAST